jgi:hypothetical protein
MYDVKQKKACTTKHVSSYTYNLAHKHKRVLFVATGLADKMHKMPCNKNHSPIDLQYDSHKYVYICRCTIGSDMQVPVIALPST